LIFRREHRHHRSHRDGNNEKKHRHSSPKRSRSPEYLFDSFKLFSYSFPLRSKRRKNDEINKTKKSIDDDIEEGETPNNGETNGASSSTKRVPLSLEEMLERNKKEQEAVAKVIDRRGLCL
jgi:uncharacterized protein YggL (DUF469 family)